MNNISKAFRALRKEGYFARQNFWCCQSCGCAAIPKDKSEKYVFFHNQDKAQLEKTGSCYLAWDGNGHEIVCVLHSSGIMTSWDGMKSSRILITCN